MSATIRSPPARMRALRALSLVLAFTAAVGLIFGTAGFTALEADRGVNVTVVDDEDAYLGYEAETETGNNSTTVTAEYHNQFSDELTLDVTVEVDGADHKEVSVTLAEGAAEQIEVTKSCSSGETVQFTFAATGSGSGVNVSLERTHSVTC